MGIIRRGPPEELIFLLKKNVDIKNFIETGTFLGRTAYWASKYFDKVYTIEISEVFYKKTSLKFGDIENINFILGDTREQLESILNQINSSALLWLDAHWSGGETYGENDECPLLEEIGIINKSKLSHSIFIDDARLFLAPPIKPHKIEQWPDIKSVIDKLSEGIHERYIVIIEDVIIAVPLDVKDVVAQYCQDINTRIWMDYLEKNKKKKGIMSKLRRIKRRTISCR